MSDGWEKPIEEMSPEQLVSVLLTVDGKGKAFKRKALERIVSFFNVGSGRYCEKDQLLVLGLIDDGAR